MGQDENSQRKIAIPPELVYNRVENTTKNPKERLLL